MSIWEVRNNKQHFTYSQIMLWVAFDRGLRLAEKRCFPCPNRDQWMKARDMIYERVMEKGQLRQVSAVESPEADFSINRVQCRQALLYPKLPEQEYA
jgi:GH15 family glucan-1,4-alpha-glucosidase